MTDKKLKIALIGFRLSGGGAEKVMAILSNYFEANNIETHIIIIVNSVSYSYSGKLLNLGLSKNKYNGIFNKFTRLFKFNNYLKNNNFDYIIDFRFRVKSIQELIISRFIYKSKVIFTIHSYLIDHYMSNNSYIARLTYNHCFANIAITNSIKEITEKKHSLSNVKMIHNPIDFDEVNLMKDKPIDLDFQYIIAVGQYETDIKQFDKLIWSYSRSILPINNFHLVIAGEGNIGQLQEIAKSLNVEEKVHFIGFQDNIFKYLKNAKFLVLCSKNEGMPMVIIESLSCETPVISFNCDSGPSEIIDGKNGILVENQNFSQLTNSMNLFLEDEKFYQFCKKNTILSVQKFSVKKIGNQWLELLKK